MNNFETGYLNIMQDIIDNGVKVPNRTGIDTYATWGQQLKVDLSKEFPLLTTRKIALRIAFEETWFFLRGETDTKKLEEKKINIWRGNTSREFLDSRGLQHLPEGHMGKGYGFQWRNFGGDYGRNDQCNSEYQYDTPVHGVDQIANVLKSLKEDPNGRRHIVCAWNPKQLDQMSLVPCHLYNQYQISEGKLNSSFVCRSWDWGYGAPYNLTGYALLNKVFAKYLGISSGNLFAIGMDVHLYENQLDMCKEQLLRTPYQAPTIKIHKELNSLDDILKMEFSDIELINYQYHPDFTNKPRMAV